MAQMKGKRFLLFLILVGAMIVGAIPAQAVMVTVDFAVFGFGAGAPMDTVSGALLLNGNSIRSVNMGMTSIDLTIDGHTYSVGEVSSWYSGSFMQSSFTVYGGTVGGVFFPGVSQGTNDFALEIYSREYPYDLYRSGEYVTTWLPYGPNAGTFTYTTANYPGIYSSSQFTHWSVTASPVPEPSTLLLFGSGLAGLLGYGRRRLKK